MISKFSVKRPYTVLVGVVLILVLGYVSFTSMQTDLLPDMNLPYAIVYTTYIGASPEEVETTVTRPIEQAMATISNIENISSTSSENLSMVILEFAQTANMDSITVDMREKLDQIEGAWSDSVGNPIIMKLNPDMMPVMVAALEGGDLSQSELTDLVENEILPELESIEGVASVSSTGTIEEQVQVVLREDKIRDVNEKVRSALDKKFDDAQAELEENKSELESGEQSLNSGQEQLKTQTGKAQERISSGSSQMLSGKLELNEKKKEIEDALSELDKSESELKTQEEQLEEGEKNLLALPAQKTALETQKTSIDQAVAAVGTLTADQVEQLNQSITQLEQALGIVQSDTSETEVITEGETEQETAALIENSPNLTQAAQEETLSEEITVEQDIQDEIITDQNVQDEATVDQDILENTAEQPVLDESTASDVPDENAEADVIQDGTDQNVLEEAGAPEEVEQEEELVLDESQDDTNQTSEIPDYGSLAEDAASAAQEMTALKAQYDQLVEQRNQLIALGVDVTLSGNDLKTNIEKVRFSLLDTQKQLEDGIAKLQEQIDKTPEQLETIQNGKDAVEQGKQQIADGRTQLNAAKEQLTAAEKQLADGENRLSGAQSQIDGARIDATIEMAVGKAQLQSGKQQIETALDQIEEQKEAAYDQSDVTELVTTDLVKNILSAQNFMMPAGYVTEDGIDFLVRVGNKLTSMKDMEELVILDLHMEDLDPIKLSDVADVVMTDNSDEIYATVNGHPGVMLTMQKQSGYSTGTVSNRIKEKFTELEETKGDIHFIKMMDQGVYIDMVVDSVIQNMLSGAGLAILVLLVFLGSFRPTLVIACSIPISIMTAIVCMYFSNITLNIISLSGLALGIGMLVDNSIVVIENIYRLRSEGYSVKKAAVEGASQVAGAIVASTLTTICVFAPILFTEGITRQLFVDMGLTIAYSLVASLVVALTLVPAMAAGLLKKGTDKKHRIFDKIQNAYAVLLKGALKVKILVILLAVGILVLSAKLAVSKGTEFMGDMESTQMSLTLTTPEGSSLADTAKVADEAIKRIETLDDVEDIGAMVSGSNMMSMMGSGSGSDREVSMYVMLKEDKKLSNDELAAVILDQTADLNCEVSVQTSNMDMSSLGGSGISVMIKGRELDKLKEIASDVADILSSVEGTRNVSDGIEEKTVEMRLVVDKNKAMSYQLTTAQIYQFLQQKLAEAGSATTLSTESNDYDVLVISDADETLTRDKIRELTIEGTNADQKKEDVPLSELVEFVDTEGFSSINRDAQNRYVSATAEIADGYNIGLVSAEVEKKLADYEVPKGYSVTMKGEDETINDAMGQVMKMMILAIVFMYLIMVAQFQSLLSPFIIIFTIPLAFTGGFLALYLTDKPVSVIAMIGFVMLAGIIVNNGIVLVDYINQLRRDGMQKKEAIVESGRSRLRPVIMTALTTILGLCTMAAGNGMGADMVQPMAIVTIGGLTYGTLMTLFVIPCVYDIFNRNRDITEKEEY